MPKAAALIPSTNADRNPVTETTITEMQKAVIEEMAQPGKYKTSISVARKMGVHRDTVDFVRRDPYCIKLIRSRRREIELENSSIGQIAQGSLRTAMMILDEQLAAMRESGQIDMEMFTRGCKLVLDTRKAAEEGGWDNANTTTTSEDQDFLDRQYRAMFELGRKYHDKPDLAGIIITLSHTHGEIVDPEDIEDDDQVDDVIDVEPIEVDYEAGEESETHDEDD